MCSQSLVSVTSSARKRGAGESPKGVQGCPLIFSHSLYKVTRPVRKRGAGEAPAGVQGCPLISSHSLNACLKCTRLSLMEGNAMGFILDGLETEAYDRHYSDYQLSSRILDYFRPLLPIIVKAI